MKNKMMIFFTILFSLVLFSCAPSADIVIGSLGDVTIDIAIQPTETTEALVKSFLGANTSLFDKEKIANNLKTENIQTLAFETNGLKNISGKFKIPAKRVRESELFTIDTANKKVTCNITKENLNSLVSTFPSDIKDYLDMLISPITSGDDLTATEYEQLIESAYGPKLANELKTAFFKVTLTCPGTIDSVKSEPEGRVRHFTGSSATITVPLSYMLSLEKPLLISVVYK